jgi:hypothetical protein
VGVVMFLVVKVFANYCLLLFSLKMDCTSTHILPLIRCPLRHDTYRSTHAVLP